MPLCRLGCHHLCHPLGLHDVCSYVKIVTVELGKLSTTVSHSSRKLEAQVAEEGGGKGGKEDRVDYAEATGFLAVETCALAAVAEDAAMETRQRGIKGVWDSHRESLVRVTRSLTDQANLLSSLGKKKR